MMDKGTVRNMQSLIPKTENSAFSWSNCKKFRLLSVHVCELGVVNDNLSLVHTEIQIELPVAAVDTYGWTERHDEVKTRLSRLRGRA